MPRYMLTMAWGKVPLLKGTPLPAEMMMHRASAGAGRQANFLYIVWSRPVGGSSFPCQSSPVQFRPVLFLLLSGVFSCAESALNCMPLAELAGTQLAGWLALAWLAWLPGLGLGRKGGRSYARGGREGPSELVMA